MGFGSGALEVGAIRRWRCRLTIGHILGGKEGVMRIGVARRGVMAGIACVMALVACGDDSAGRPVGAPSSTPSVSGSVAGSSVVAPVTSGPEAGAGAFPVTVTGANGEVTIDERPERIVVLSASLTESVFAVGAGDQVVAVDSASDHPARAPVTDLSGFRPNVEAIGKLEPDLVLLSRDRDGVVATLETIGILALVLPSAADLDEVYAQIATIGDATGHPEEAADLVDEMRAEIERQFARVPTFTDRPSYFYELSADYHSITSETFVGSILGRLGLVSVADGVDPAAGAYPQLSAEHVLEADPRWVFVAHTDGSVPTAAEIAARPGWGALDAVATGRVVMLDVDLASRWGPRVVQLVTAIVDAVVAGEGP